MNERDAPVAAGRQRVRQDRRVENKGAIDRPAGRRSIGDGGGKRGIVVAQIATKPTTRDPQASTNAPTASFVSVSRGLKCRMRSVNLTNHFLIAMPSIADPILPAP